MTNQERFELCMEQGRKIVEAHRAEAPEGCDPQNTFVASGIGAFLLIASA